MKIGLFGMPMHPGHRPQSETYDEVAERIILADQLGYEEVFIGEHISCTNEPIASPLIFLASLIHRTKNIRLGTGVVALPNHHPALVAGEVAQFDHMSKGRFNFGIGPGGLASDMELFDVLDNEMRGKKMYEAIDIILDIWKSNPPYKYKTENYDFGLKDMVIPELNVGTMLKPFQKPNPPIFSTAMSPYSGSIKVAVERGWSPMSANFCGEAVVASHWQKYLEGCESVGKEPTGDEWRVARNIVIRETDAEAEEAALNPDGGNFFYLDYLWKVLVAANYTAVMKTDPNMADADVKVSDLVKDIVIYGSPDTVAQKIQAMREKSGNFGTLLLSVMDGEGANEAGERQTMTLLANEVLPKINSMEKASSLAKV
jgi:alkanesulfonate monooxygenase SsuD/methylene tetrahydromethanopterin reductase-like flavin-dependent oxidoreductase (luciferase family)